MATGLGANLITFSPDTTIKSADVNSNLTALNTVLTPSFHTVTMDQPPILAAGNQETGAVGRYFNAHTTSQPDAYFVNFKTHMTNYPTSITLTNTAGSTNFTSVATQTVTKDGFLFILTATATGGCYWYGTYTTVGNCLLAVDAQARTFDHHCDAQLANGNLCGHISRAAPLSALRMSALPELPVTFAYTCPTCGATESFNAELSAADEADMTPQGSGAYRTTRGAQAVMIRQLLALLGLPLA